MKFGGGLSSPMGETRVTCEKLWVFIYDGWMDGMNDASRTRRRTCATRTTDADADASARRITTPRTRAHANIIHVLEYSLHMFLTHYYISALARARAHLTPRRTPPPRSVSLRLVARASLRLQRPHHRRRARRRPHHRRLARERIARHHERQRQPQGANHARPHHHRLAVHRAVEPPAAVGHRWNDVARSIDSPIASSCNAASSRSRDIIMCASCDVTPPMYDTSHRTAPTRDGAPSHPPLVHTFVCSLTRLRQDRYPRLRIHRTHTHYDTMKYVAAYLLVRAHDARTR